VCALDGMAGVGKSALAVHLAHRLAPRYPDGQLFIDLHGYTQGYPPRTAGDALEALLRSLRVPPTRIPRDLEERAALYRERLAGTRTLILLDNADAEAQVAPLLPGTPGSLVLITGRRRLKALDDAYCLSLEPLHPADAHSLFRTATGPARAASDGPAVEEIVALCGQLPLAVRIAAALLRHRPTWSADRLADLLRDERHRISSLTDGDRRLEAVFNLSYGGLSPAQQSAFRRLGLVPGPDIDAYTAAALLDQGLGAARTLLEDLVDHNLLSQPEPDRYRFHDLIRIHARTRAEEDPPQERELALDRMLGYHLSTARSADEHLARRTVPHPADVDSPPRHRPSLASRQEAVSWVRAELPGLVAGVEIAASTGRDRHVAGMSAALHGYLYVEGPWTYALTLHAAAADAAARLGDRLGEATALHSLGRVRRMLADYPAAAALHRQALELYREIDHRRGQAHALDSLGRIAWLTGDYPRASEHLERALGLYREVEDPLGEAGALNGLGRVRRLTGGYPEALDAHRRALGLCRAAGDRIGQATALNDLGRVLAETGDLDAAERAQQEAFDLYRSVSHRVGIAHALHETGRIHGRRGEYDAAVADHRRALALYREMGHRLGQASALGELGRTVFLMTGGAEPAQAARELDAALSLFRSVGDLQGEAYALNGRGHVLTASGAPLEARALHNAAFVRARTISCPFDEAEALEGMAESHLATGDRASGISLLRQAAKLYRRLGVPEAGPAEARLEALARFGADTVFGRTTALPPDAVRPA
jgi:tetratricopeptide (TPR) repeat protein